MFTRVSQSLVVALAFIGIIAVGLIIKDGNLLGLSVAPWIPIAFCFGLIVLASIAFSTGKSFLARLAVVVLSASLYSASVFFLSTYTHIFVR